MKSRRRKLLLGWLAVALTAAGWWFWPRPLHPPQVDLSFADPVVSRTIKEAYSEFRKNPRSGKAWGRLGMVLVAHDLRREGNDCFVQAERLDAREFRWPYYQGITLSQGDPETALVKLKQAVELSGPRSSV